MQKKIFVSVSLESVTHDEQTLFKKSLKRNFQKFLFR